VEARGDLVEQAGAREVDAVERHGDLEDLLAVAHVERVPHLDGSVEAAEPPPAFLLE